MDVFVYIVSYMKLITKETITLNKYYTRIQVKYSYLLLIRRCCRRIWLLINN